MTKQTSAYRTDRITNGNKLHKKESCSQLKNAENVIEVVADNYTPTWDWCQFCSGDIEGVQPAQTSKATGKMLSTKLREASSLDDLKD